ncbi:Mitochodrial transcription termination factor-related [Cinnamomum micranthum f. kanehirae]|uniref:Mitochodrial transcription termination factor-related n=1 Tax=Cinnamomum micranthum f. kanehirae TaxID=337451 RepID=A0A443NS63_9MAGN|nr:Mitochodrial transcription termination factor-related [Cinnamomum micranthum f. kanehirae]
MRSSLPFSYQVKSFLSFTPFHTSMFSFRFSRNLPQLSSSIKDSKTRGNFYVFLVQKPSSLISVSSLSNSPTTEDHSFTVSYLINSCGLSPESALLASKRVIIKNHEKPDAVLALLKNHGFYKPHITKLITRLPLLLLANPEKTLKPKLDFFLGSGVTGPVMVKMLSSNPSLFERSLTKQLIPSFDFLKSFVRTNENINAALRRSTQVLQARIQGTLVPNISILRNHGVPESRIISLIITHPRTLALMPDQFSKVVKTVEGFGFDRLSSAFVIAVRVMSAMSRSTWERKLEVYKRVGWSEDEFLTAFKKQPMCMNASEKKIKRTLEFVAKELGTKASDICQCPNVLLLSFERRIVPRCAVMQVLISRNLIRKDFSLNSVMLCNELDFLRKFVTKYQEEAPEALMAYQGRRAPLGSDIGSEDCGETVML